MPRTAFIQRIFAGSLTCMLVTSAIGDQLPGEWTEMDRQAFVAGCQMGILRPAYRDYLLRQGMSATDIPDDPFDLIPTDRRDETLALLIDAAAPFLQVCDCIIDTVSMELHSAEAKANPVLFAAKAKEVLETGRCAVDPGPGLMQPQIAPGPEVSVGD